MSVNRIIYRKDTEEYVPSLPFVVIKNDGIVGEADSVRGIINILIPGYCDAEDRVDDWNLRVRYARKQAMFALESDFNVVVYDRSKGIINNNYAAAHDDDDYEVPEDSESIKIFVDSEIDFIRSLISLNIIMLLEREDIEVFSQNLKISCDKCAHNNANLCNVYYSSIDEVKDNCECGLNDINEKRGSFYKFIE